MCKSHAYSDFVPFLSQNMPDVLLYFMYAKLGYVIIMRAYDIQRREEKVKIDLVLFI